MADNETIADIIAEIRALSNPISDGIIAINGRSIADRLEAAWERERRLLKSCARWILCHDIYGHAAKELLVECKEVLNDDGQFLFKEDEQ